MPRRDYLGLQIIAPNQSAITAVRVLNAGQSSVCVYLQ